MKFTGLLANSHVLEGTQIPMITELCKEIIDAILAQPPVVNDSNVQFLETDDEDSPDTELYLAQPFACGTAFAISVLDSIMSTTYFNDTALTLIRSLVTGGATPELELMLAEGAGLQSRVSECLRNEAILTLLSYRRPGRTPNWRRNVIAVASILSLSLISARKWRLEVFFKSKAYMKRFFLQQKITYGRFFSQMLREQSVLCIGLYRTLDPNVCGQTETKDRLYAFQGTSRKRYVVTNPPYDLILRDDDIVGFLEQISINNKG